MIDIAAHLGSLGAVLIYFRNDVKRIVSGAKDFLTVTQTRDRAIFLMLSTATIPIIVLGGIFVALDWVDLLRNPLIIGSASLFFGALLWHSDRSPVIGPDPEKNHMGACFSWKNAIIIGLSQALAIIPGTSRSGITMTAARYLGISRPEAARFSMLLAIPTILIFGAVAGLDLATTDHPVQLRDGLIVGILSLLICYGVIHLFMQMTRKMTFTPFVIYRVLLGIFLIGWALGAQ